MGRPAVTEQRRKEVLDAFVRCVARYGLNGASLERIAEQSGLKRPLIRHHLGNREQMVEALVAHVIANFDQQTLQMQAHLDGKARIPALLDLLFAEGTVTDQDLVLAFAALTAQAGQDEAMRTALLHSLTSFEAILHKEVTLAYPQAHKTQAAAVSQALMALYFNLDSLSPLQPPQQWRDSSRYAAELLIKQLQAGAP